MATGQNIADQTSTFRDSANKEQNDLDILHELTYCTQYLAYVYTSTSFRTTSRTRRRRTEPCVVCVALRCKRGFTREILSSHGALYLRDAAIGKPLQDWKRPPGRHNHAWLRATLAAWLSGQRHSAHERSYSTSGPVSTWMGDRLREGANTISVCNQPTRSAQLCICLGSLNRVPV